jgi:hypothetical protein
MRASSRDRSHADKFPPRIALEIMRAVRHAVTTRMGGPGIAGAAGAAGEVLTSHGPGVAPTFEPVGGGGGGAGGVTYIPLVTGAEPLELLSDGAGHLMLVAVDL